MLIDEANFSTYITNRETRQAAADSINELIEEKGIVLYGRFLEDGTAVGFSTKKEPIDTHVVMGLGMSEMAFYAPPDKFIQRDRPNEEDELKALRKLVKQLKGEISIITGDKVGSHE